MNARILCSAGFMIFVLSAVGVKSYADGEGKVSGKVFANWYYDVSDDASLTKKSAIDLTRAYFGYDYKINDEFSTNVNLDVGRVNELIDTKVDTSLKVTVKKDERFEAFLKTAFLKWKGLIPSTALSIGLIPYFQFGVQEKAWGYRYIFESFMDKNKYGSSADLGISAEVAAGDKTKITVGVTNGEGYKKPQDSNGQYRTGIGLNLTPLKGLTVYGYGDYMPITGGADSAALSTLAGFVGYQPMEKLRLGFEYNYQMNQDGYDARDVSGLSAYTTFSISKPVELFARYDMAGSKDDWNTSLDGRTIIAGVQYSPVKNVKVAADFQSVMPKVDGSISRNRIFANIEFAY